MTVRIVTDSTCDLPVDIITKLGIRVLPLYIQVGNREYLDGIDITRDEFYKNLPTLPEHPTTAVPSPLKFHALYDALADEGASEVLSIHISSTLSAITNVARAAAAETTSVPVSVLDSRQLSLGMGFLVHTAAELARNGMTVKEILVALEDQIKRTHVWAVLDTLKYPAPKWSNESCDIHHWRNHSDQTNSEDVRWYIRSGTRPDEKKCAYPACANAAFLQSLREIGISTLQCG